MDFQTTLYETLKDRLLQIEGSLEFGCGESRIRELYYLKHLDDNLIEPMSEVHIAEYSDGSGNELDGKMNSIRSSSAMTFNLLGNGPVQVASGEIAGTYDVIYEFKLPTLSNNSHPANLDAYLQSEDVDIYCEMKMLEWVGTANHSLRDAYLHTQNYTIPPEDATHFVELFEELINGNELVKNGGIEWIARGRYDGLQMSKHLLSIYNRVIGEVDYKPRRIVLLNCVWEMINPGKLGKYEQRYLTILDEEHEGFQQFKYIAMKNIAPLFQAKGIELDIQYISVVDFIHMLKLDDEHKFALQRYII